MTVRPLLSAQGVTLEDMIVELRRELTLRRMVYPETLNRTPTAVTIRQDSRLRAALGVLVGLQELIESPKPGGGGSDDDDHRPPPPMAA